MGLLELGGWDVAEARKWGCQMVCVSGFTSKENIMETMAISPEREERRRRQKELADQLKSSGAMDEIFAKIDAGTPLTGDQGLLGGRLKAALERGLDAELTEHVGYERGDAEASLYPN